MRLVFCTVMISAFAAGSALAAQAPAAGAAAPAGEASAKPSRTVFICDTSAETRRGFSREYGKAEFVKAEAAAAKGEAWTAPKCVTAAEARKLRKLASK
jgi:hypothetical protein